MARGLRVCVDRVVPKNLQESARAKATEENPANAPTAFEMALVTGKMWKPGRVLTVCFLDGDPAVQEKVKTYANQWSQWANIQFDFVSRDGIVRISFKEEGSWSAIGTDALVTEYFKPGEATMNFGWLKADTDDKEYSRVVLHEFGHALGCIHEHQNPAGGIKWNKDAVYRALGGPPNNWDKATVDHNMFDTYGRTLTQFTAFDPDSIMLYSFPKEWTLDGMEMHENDVPSPSDRKFIAARYPKMPGGGF